MTVEFTKFTGKAPTLEAIEVTSENVEEIAVWMGVNSYSVEKTLVGGERRVTFYIHRGDSPPREYRDPVVRTKIGDWLVKFPEHIDGNLRDWSDRFYSVSRQTIDEFVIQQRDNGEIDFSAAPYDR